MSFLRPKAVIDSFPSWQRAGLICVPILLFTFQSDGSPYCGIAAQETKLAHQLSEMQRGTGIIEQTDKQTWLSKV